MQMMVRNGVLLFAASVTAFVLSGCGDDAPTSPTPDDVVGAYEATTLTVTEGGTTTDVLAEGGSLEITLDGDGSTSGAFVIPPSFSETGQEEQASMEGTWELNGRTVTLDQPADTFVRDASFTFVSGRLEADETFGGATVQVVLVRS